MSEAPEDESGGRSKLKIGGAVVLVLVGAVVAAYFLGIIGVPSAGLVDRGDWGTVGENRTEIVTTLWVENQNPIGINLGEGLSADYDVRFNDVKLAEGEKEAIDVPKGRSTLKLHTALLNERLPAFWVTYVRNDETIHMDINGTLTLDAGLKYTHDIEKNQTVLADSTPMISALSAAANGTQGEYTKSVSASSVTDDSLLDTGETDEVTVGYEVERGYAEWGNVTRNQTVATVHLVVHNPGDVPVPASPDGIGLRIEMNDQRIFRADTGSFSVTNLGPDAVIPPGETREVVVAVRMDNQRVDEWFTSHVRNDERTDVTAEFQFVFEVPATGSTIRVPQDSPATYDCDFQTAILVDNQTTQTTCGEGL
jgi:LEA14-like dessication related protein